MALALSDLLEKHLGVKAYPRTNPEVAAVGTSAVKVLSNNPNRVALLIANLSANTLYVAPDSEVSSSLGIRLAPNGAQITAQWNEDFALVAYEWFAVASGASSAIYVLELVTQ